MEMKECNLIEIVDGQAHIIGFYESNENDYGPHPLRYVECCGLIKPYDELADEMDRGVALAEIEADCVQYPHDGEFDTDETTARDYVYDALKYRLVTREMFASGLLRDGKYRVEE